MALVPLEGPAVPDPPATVDGAAAGEPLPVESGPEDAQAAPPPAAEPGTGMPRWLLLLIGAACATIAIAGLRSVAWLVAPVFLALVVVIALTPVQRNLRRLGAPRWLAT